MQRFKVRYYKSELSSTEYEIEVEAASADAARERVRAGMTGEIDLTAEEEETIAAGKENLRQSEYECLADPSDPYAVVEVKG